MKLLSSKRNNNNKQLLCEDCVFDPSLIKVTSVDVSEKFITLEYDFDECGHPLNLPFDAERVEFGVKLSPHNIHIDAIIEADEETAEAFKSYANDVGEFEFDVRMSNDEKLSLLLSILWASLQENNSDNEQSNFVDEDIQACTFENAKEVLNAVIDIIRGKKSSK